MCPESGLEPLRVGPEDVGLAEAGDLVRKVGVHNQAKGLIQAMAKQMPRELRTAMQRHEHRERSEYLDLDEVQRQAEGTVGAENIKRVTSARVKGNKLNPLDSNVVIQYETPQERIGRCMVQYNDHTFPDSVAAFDDALRTGTIKLTREEPGSKEQKDQIDRLKSEIRRLSAQGSAAPNIDEVLAKANGEEAPPVPPTASDDAPPVYPPVVLPEGVTAGDPGWPVDDQGDPVWLPDATREQLIAEHESAQAAIDATTTQAQATQAEIDEKAAQVAKLEAELEQAKNAPAPAGDASDVDLQTIELPEGNADELIAGLPFYSDDVVAALELRAKAVKTKEAAAAELRTRASATE